MSDLLIGNSFPMNLIKRKVCITTETTDLLRAKIAESKTVYSFWGHSNTVKVASDICGYDLTPDAGLRPELNVSAMGLPCFDGIEFNECWILSPEYIKNYRPNIGEEVQIDMIKKWNVLHMKWL